MLLLLEIVATILVVIGVWFIALPNIKGQYMLIVAQALWTIFAIAHWHVFFAIQSFVLLVLNCYAVYNWRKKGVGCNASN